MPRKVDQKAAVLAAAQGSGAVFEALADEVEAVEAVAADVAEKTSEAVKAAAEPQQKEEPTMNAQTFAPNFDVAAGTERMRAMFDGKTLVERSQRIAQEAAELARGNVEAMVASSRIAAQNATTIGQEAAEAGRKSFEEASEAIKSFADAKTPSELLRLQGEFARSYMETMIAEGTRLSETVVKLTGEAMQPVQNRFAVAAEKVKSLGNG